MTDPFSDKGQHLLPLPDHILLDIARNEAAQDDYRKLAVEILINRKSPKVKHPDLYPLVDVLMAELELTEIPIVLPEQGSGPLQASVTTATVFGSDSSPFAPREVELLQPTTCDCHLNEKQVCDICQGVDPSVQLMDEPPPKPKKPKKSKKDKNAAAPPE